MNKIVALTLTASIALASLTGCAAKDAQQKGTNVSGISNSEFRKKDTIRRKSGTQLKKRRTNTMPTLTTQMTKALDTWTPTGCQGELLRADEVNLYYQNARLGRVDYMTIHEGISDKTIEHS